MLSSPPAARAHLGHRQPEGRGPLTGRRPRALGRDKSDLTELNCPAPVACGNDFKREGQTVIRNDLGQRILCENLKHSLYLQE